MGERVHYNRSVCISAGHLDYICYVRRLNILHVQNLLLVFFFIACDHRFNVY